MRKIIPFFLIITLLLSSLDLSAQTRVSYNLQMAYSDSLTKNFTMCLDISDKVYFYEAEFIDPKYSAYKTSQTMQFIIRQNGSHDNIMFMQDFNSDFYKVKTHDIITWKLTNDYKTVDQYKLQKATTSFGGRQWDVWFCNEVPFTEGPYKFNGLPGLVFEVEDTKHIFKYSLIKIENINKHSSRLDFNDKGLAYITWEKFNRILLDFYENPYRKEWDLLSQGGEYIVNDKNITEYDLGGMIKDFQKMVRNNLPPAVELDKNVFQNIKNQK